MRDQSAVEAYPLHWPAGWPRTPDASRVHGRHHFKRPSARGWREPWTFAAARDALIGELRLLKATGVVISSNFRTSRGIPVEGGRRPDDQGIAVYFTLDGQHLAMARDPYVEAEANMRTLALAISHMRGLERHGGSFMMRQAFSGFAALPAPQTWWEVLGVGPGASKADIVDAYRRRAMRAHPDQGGSAAAMAELNRARDEALRHVDG